MSKQCNFLVNGVRCKNKVYNGKFNTSKLDACKYISQFKNDYNALGISLSGNHIFNRCSKHCEYKDYVIGTDIQRGLTNIILQEDVIRDYHDLDFCKKDSIKTRVEATCYPAYKSVMVPNDNEYRKDINSLLSKMKKDFDKERDLHRSAINHIDECIKQRNLYTSAYINPSDSRFFYLPIESINEYYGHINIIPVFENYKSECITNLGNKDTFDYDTYIMNISQKYGVDFKIADCVSELSLLHKEIDFKKMHDYLINKLQTNIGSKNILNAIKVCQKLSKLNETCNLESYLSLNFTGKEWSDFIDNYNEIKELCRYNSDLRELFVKQAQKQRHQQTKKIQEQTRKRQEQARRIQQQRVKKEPQLTTRLAEKSSLQSKKEEEEALLKKMMQQNLKHKQEKKVNNAQYLIDNIFTTNGKKYYDKEIFLKDKDISGTIASNIADIYNNHFKKNESLRLDLFYNIANIMYVHYNKPKHITDIGLNAFSFLLGIISCAYVGINQFIAVICTIMMYPEELNVLCEEFTISTKKSSKKFLDKTLVFSGGRTLVTTKKLLETVNNVKAFINSCMFITCFYKTCGVDGVIKEKIDKFIDYAYSKDEYTSDDLYKYATFIIVYPITQTIQTMQTQHKENIFVIKTINAGISNDKLKRRILNGEKIQITVNNFVKIDDYIKNLGFIC